MNNTKNVITDIVKKIGGLGFVDAIRITGENQEVKIEAIDNDKTVIIKGKSLIDVDGLAGTFGMANLGLLKGLMDFSSYKTDGATFTVKTDKDKGAPIEFEFRDQNNMGSNFRLMAAGLVPEQPTVAISKWDAEFTPAVSKIQEFKQLAGLYSANEQYFGVKLKDHNILFTIGEEGSSTHNATMVFAEGVAGELKGDLVWPTAQFLAILGMADKEAVVKITSKGALSIVVNTEFNTFEYVMPARRR
jgi:hypothetical protein